MYIRSPLLFSSIFFIVILLSNIIYFELPNKMNFIEIIYLQFMPNLTFFFFTLLLTSFFFNKNGSQTFIKGNRNNIIILAVLYSVIFFVVNFLIKQLIIKWTSVTVIKMYKFKSSMGANEIEQIFNIIVTLVSCPWTLIINGIILMLLIRYTNNYYQKISGNKIEINTNLREENEIESRKLYGVIYGSIFCIVTYGLIINIYSPLILTILNSDIYYKQYAEMNMMLIMVSSLVITAINFTILYCNCLKYIKKSYQWVPTSSLLPSAGLTTFLFGLGIVITSLIMIPFIVIFKSYLLFICWACFGFVLLYFISRYFIKRYFG